MGRTAKRYGIEIKDDIETELRFRRIETRLDEVTSANDLGTNSATTRTTSIPQVTGFRVVGSTPGAITLGWTAVAISDLRRYRLDIAEDIGFSVNPQTFYVAGTQFQFSTVSSTGGGGGTTIFARVRAESRASGNGAYSITLNTTTGQAQTADVADNAITEEQISNTTLQGLLMTVDESDGAPSFANTAHLTFNSDHFYLSSITQASDTTPLVNLIGPIKTFQSGVSGAFTSGGNEAKTFNHPLGSKPQVVHTWLQCLSTDGSYAVGDTISADAVAAGAGIGFTTRVTATQIILYVNQEASPFQAVSTSSPHTATNLDETKWGAFVTAILFL